MFKRLSVPLLLLTCLSLSGLVMGQPPTPPALPEEAAPLCTAFTNEPQESRVAYYIGEGSAYLNNRQLVMAKNSFACIVQVIDPNYAPAWLGRARTNIQLGQYDRAQIDLNRAIQLNANYTVAHNDHGYLMMLLGEYESAEASFERALQANPNYVTATNNLAIAYVLQEKHEDAITLLEAAIDDSSIDGVLAQLRSPNYDTETPILFRHLDARLYALLGIVHQHQALQQFRNYTDLFNITGQLGDDRVYLISGGLDSSFNFEMRLDDGAWLLLSDYPADATGN